MADLNLTSIHISKNKKRFVPTATPGRAKPRKKRPTWDDSSSPHPSKTITSEPCNDDAVEQSPDHCVKSLDIPVDHGLSEKEPSSTFTSTVATTTCEPLLIQARSTAAPSQQTQPVSTTPPMDPAEVEKIARGYHEQLAKKRRRCISSGLTKEELLKLAEEEQEEEVRERERQKEESRPRPPMVPQVKIVNGEIVLDQDSLVVDWNYNSFNGDQREVIEITPELEKKETQRLQGRARTVAKPWTIEETELFYDLLQEHGLAFELISTKIPKRNAKQIRNKYYKENAENPFRIQDCLKR